MSQEVGSPEGQPKPEELLEMWKAQGWEVLAEIAQEFRGNWENNLERLQSMLTNPGTDDFHDDRKIFKVGEEELVEIVSPKMANILRHQYIAEADARRAGFREKRDRVQVAGKKRGGSSAGERGEKNGWLQTKALYKELESRYGELALAKYFQDNFPNYQWSVVRNWLEGLGDLASNVRPIIIKILRGYKYSQRSKEQ